MYDVTKIKEYVLLILIILSFVTPSHVCSQQMQFGLNGHPFAQPVYKEISVQKQLNLVKEMGVNWYRVDCYGSAIQPQMILSIRELVAEAKKREINVLPCIFPPININDIEDLQVIYRISYEYARKIVGELKNDIHVWELSNELDNVAIVRKGELSYLRKLWNYGVPNGAKMEHYESTRIKKVMVLLKGLSDGVHAADPVARRIINATYIHYGFFDHLVSNSIGFEIVGWHWYSDMGDLTKTKGNYNLLERLNKYDKPIWITEINRRGGSQGSNGEMEQYAYLKDTLKRYLLYSEKYNIRNIFIYELLDEPNFGSSNPESYYGVVRVQKGLDGKWTINKIKKAFHVIKDIDWENK